MITYNFDQIIDRRSSESLKWNAYETDVLPMWVADMDFVSPAPVLEALHRRVEHGVFGYPEGISGRSADNAGLRRTIVARMQERYHWQIQEEDILLVPGVVTGFNLACHMLAAERGEVLIQTPVYPPILHAAEVTGMVCRGMELTRRPDGSYEIDWDIFEASLNSHTRAFLLCNPHNPVGRVFTQDELTRMADACLRHGVPILSDEIHCDLIYSEYAHIPIASLAPEIARQTITLLAPSKTYNLAGLECSLAIIPDAELRRAYQKATKGLVGWVNLMGLVAAEAAYRDGQEWLDQLLVYLQGNRDALHRFVQEHLPGIQMSRVEGTYLAWLDCRQAKIEGNPQQFFLEKARVAMNDGPTFGPGGEGCVRLNFGCPRAVLMEALQRMQAALASA